MASGIQPSVTPPPVTAPPPPARGAGRGPAGPPLVAPDMARCECAGDTFEEVARRMHAERLSAEQAVRRTGCGQNCGACIPDLLQFLARR